MPRDGILGHQFNNRLEFFARYYSQSLPLAGFKENHPLLFTKNPRNKKLESIHEINFVERYNEGRKSDKKIKSKKITDYVQKARPKMPFKNIISGFFFKLPFHAQVGVERAYSIRQVSVPLHSSISNFPNPCYVFRSNKMSISFTDTVETFS
jgi:hypothetical protein